MPRLIFFGTPEFAVTILRGLIDDPRYNVCGVVTQPDKPAGRRGVPTPSPVKTFAESASIPTYDFDAMNRLIETVRSLHPDLGVVAAYGKILPQDLLGVPKFGFLNVHPSLLPKYRGASPIRSAILEGERETGVTIIEMDEGMDTGPVVAQARVPIAPGETARTLTSKLATLGSDLLRKEVPIFIAGKQGRHTLNPPQKQDNSKASYTKILRREDGKIDWSMTPARIDAFVRGMNPRPGAYTFYGEKRFKIYRAQALRLSCHVPPGTVIEGFPDELRVAAGEGVVCIFSMDRPGGGDSKARFLERVDNEIPGIN